MGIHEDVEPVLFRNAENSDGVLYPLLIILPWPCMLDCFPGEDISNRVVAPAAQADEVRGSILGSEWTVYKGDVVAVKKVGRDM